MIVRFTILSLDNITTYLYTNFLKIILTKIKIKHIKIQKLPIKSTLITLLKSPHVNKKAMEQFWIHKHKTIITFKNHKMNISKILKLLIINKPKNIKITFSIKGR